MSSFFYLVGGSDTFPRDSLAAKPLWRKYPRDLGRDSPAGKSVNHKKQLRGPLFRKRTTPTERPPLVGE
jgi:hypothetical protein